MHFRRLCYRKAAPPSPMTDNKDVCKRIAPINRTVLFWSHRSVSTGTIETIEAWSHKLLRVALAASLGGETESFQRLHHSLNMKDTFFSRVAASDVVGSSLKQLRSAAVSLLSRCVLCSTVLSMSWHGHWLGRELTLYHSTSRATSAQRMPQNQTPCAPSMYPTKLAYRSSLSLFSLSLSLCLYLFLCLSVCLSVWLSGCLAVWLSGCLAVWLSACLPVCPSVSLSLSLSLSMHKYKCRNITICVYVHRRKARHLQIEAGGIFLDFLGCLQGPMRCLDG